MTTEGTGGQSERLRINAESGETDRDASASIAGSLNAARAFQAAELAEMQLLTRAIAACARREQARKAAVSQEGSADLRRAELDAAAAAERNRVISGLAEERVSEALRLIRE